MKTADEWVDELGNGMWASDVEKIQRDTWEAATKAQMERASRIGYLMYGEVKEIGYTPFPSEAK